MSARIIPISPEPEPATWQPIEVVVPPRLPRITPGEYGAVTVGCRRYEAFRRQVLRLDFDVYSGPVTNGGVVIATVPLYLRWSGKKPTPTSKLGRLLHIARLEPSRRPVSLLSALAHKLWRVNVSDAQHDSKGDPLSEATTYSVISQVLERL
jgi:hypothetical protein